MNVVGSESASSSASARSLEIGEGDALIVVDVQRDFLPGIDAIHAINGKPDDETRALQTMLDGGATLHESSQIPSTPPTA